MPWPVLATVAECAFIDAAVIILLGDDRLGRRRTRSDDCGRGHHGQCHDCGFHRCPLWVSVGHGLSQPRQGAKTEFAPTFPCRSPRLSSRRIVTGTPDMTDRFRLTIGQLNATVGDLHGNATLARDAWASAKAAGAQMLALPEMFLTGYQTQDLVLKPAFQRDAGRCWMHWRPIAPTARRWESAAPWAEDDKLYNAYRDPAERADRRARPQARTAATSSCSTNCGCSIRARSADPIRSAPLRIGSPICEDAWWQPSHRNPGRDRGRDPDRAERQPLPPRQAGPAHGPHGRPRRRNRTAAGLCQHGRRAGRPGL